MAKHKEASGVANPCRGASRLWMVLTLCLFLHTVAAQATGPRAHFDLEAGDATFTLHEFAKQSGLQVGFDPNILKGLKTRAVHGELEASDALNIMLRGTHLVFDFVNERAIAVTLQKPSLLRRVWHRLTTRPAYDSDDGLEQVLISGAAESGTQPLLGAQTITLSRDDIDRSGLATAEDFLHTLPQVFGGGPTEDTVLGREASTNSARGSGINLRGLDAGATLVLIDGNRIAPSGTAGTFIDVTNIPLSMVDHIDVLPDAASARYGADAIGGVINFVTRSNFSGAQTQARAGGVTDGSMGQHQLSQLLGTRWDSGRALLAFEYFQQDALLARYRWQESNDLTPYGGNNFDTVFGSPGTISVGGQNWAIPKGQNGAGLTAAELIQGTQNLYDQEQGAYVTPSEKRYSVFGKLSTELTDGVTLFSEALWSQRDITNIAAANLPLTVFVPSTNPFYVNPTGGTGLVTVYSGSSADFGPPVAQNRIDTGNFDLGVALPFGRNWTASGRLGYTFESQHEVQHGLLNETTLETALMSSDPATAFDPFGDGSNTNPATLARIAGNGSYDSMSTLKSVVVTASGGAVSLPSGDVESTLGAEYRDQTLSSYSAAPTPGSALSSDLGRRMGAAFAELHVPLIGRDNSLPLVRTLDISVGGRYERYSDVGGAAIPKLGLTYSPAPSLVFRTTWTKSFRPPNLPDLASSGGYSQLLTFADPTSATGVTTALVRFGANPDLQPERARTLSIGADLTPQPLPGLGLSLTYFAIRYSGRIDDVQIAPDLLQDPQFAWLVNRNFTAAQLNAACAQGTFVSTGPCQSPAVGAILDNRFRNLALLKTSGLDLVGRYRFSNSLGKFELGLNGTYLLEYAQANTPDSPLLNLLNTPTYPINFRFRESNSWTLRGFGISGFVNFQNSYKDTLSVPNRSVGSWTTLDMQLSYETGGDTSSWLGRMQFALSAQNVFDKYPPFLNNQLVGVGYDQENADLYGRVVSLDIRKRW